MMKNLLHFSDMQVKHCWNDCKFFIEIQLTNVNTSPLQTKQKISAYGDDQLLASEMLNATNTLISITAQATHTHHPEMKTKHI
jgi:hypothetical protein